ncbi:VOC family protein [Corynebacterium halotolerans]|uniref:VOC family protein n=1 Tax=Corynebacterium halotolerans TaxID=225326 RepID=UPI003CF7F4A3
MDFRAVTVGVPVRDLHSATIWYQKVLGVGDPEHHPAEGVVEFSLGVCWLQLEESEERAGCHGITVNLEIADLRGEHGRLESAGIRLTDIESVPGVVEYFEAIDADDNRIGFVRVVDPD